jgi:hypothetical protein
MPSSHRRYAECTPERFRRWAASIGPETVGLITAILASRPDPEQGFRTCLGLLRLYRDLPRERAEAVSARAVEIGGLTCKTITALIATHKPNRAFHRTRRRHGTRQPARPRLLSLRTKKMLTNPTIEMLRELGLSGMASVHELEAQPEAKEPRTC